MVKTLTHLDILVAPDLVVAGIGALAMTGKVALCIGALFLSAMGGMGVAKADTFDFSYSGPGFGGVQAMGTLTATLQPSGNYMITGITGERNNMPITFLLAPGASQTPGGTNDNLLHFPTTPYLDDQGFAYTAGGANYGVFYYAGDYYDGPAGGPQANLDSFNVTHNSPAPVPGGGLLSFVALGIAVLAWHRKAITAIGFRDLAGRSKSHRLN